MEIAVEEARKNFIHSEIKHGASGIAREMPVLNWVESCIELA